MTSCLLQWVMKPLQKGRGAEKAPRKRICSHGGNCLLNNPYLGSSLLFLEKLTPIERKGKNENEVDSP